MVHRMRLRLAVPLATSLILVSGNLAVGIEDKPVPWGELALREVSPGVFRVADDGGFHSKGAGDPTLPPLTQVEVTHGGAVWLRASREPGRKSGRVFPLGHDVSYSPGKGELTINTLGRPRLLYESGGKLKSKIYGGRAWRNQPTDFGDSAVSRADLALAADGARWRIVAEDGPPVLTQTYADDVIRHEFDDTQAMLRPLRVEAASDFRVWVSWAEGESGGEEVALDDVADSEIPESRPAVAVTEFDGTSWSVIREDMWLDADALGERQVVPWGQRGTMVAAPSGELWATTLATVDGHRKGEDPLWEISVWDGRAWRVAANIADESMVRLAFGPDGKTWVNGLTSLEGSEPIRYRLPGFGTRRILDVAYGPDGSAWVLTRNGLLYAIRPECREDPRPSLCSSR